MKAVVLDDFGSSKELRYRDIDDPTLSNNEILVQIKSAAVNHFDLVIRKGKVSLPNHLPLILGSDGAGIVETIGSEVSNVSEGERVLITGGGYGYSKNGTYAEKIVVSPEKVFNIPKDVSLDMACAAGLTYRTAWYALKTKGNITSEEAILIQGGSSGVGIAALQLAKHWGAWVATTAGTNKKVDALIQMGADLAVNYRKENLSRIISSHGKVKKLDLILDLVGGPDFPANLQLLKNNGRILTVGYLGGNQLNFLASELIRSEIQIQGINTRKTDPDALEQIFQLLAEKKIEPVVNHILPLNKASKAHEIIETEGVFGKILLHP